MSDLKPPSRQQLAKFLPDQETIRKFEQLFAIVPQDYSDDIQALGDLAEEISIQAGSAESRAALALALLSKVSKSLELIEQAPSPKPEKRKRHGVFVDTTTQTAAAINTAYAMTFNTTSLTKGVYIGSPTSRIYVDTKGTYNFQFSVQLDKTSGGVGLVWIWPRVNGTDVADSASQVRIQGNDAELIAAWNFVLELNSGDYFELMWEVDTVDIQLQSYASTAVHPAVPSVILTVSDNI